MDKQDQRNESPAPVTDEITNGHMRALLSQLEKDIGLWRLDVESGSAWRNLRHDQIFGHENALPEWTFNMFLDHVVAADRDKVRSLFQTAVDNAQQWSFECRIQRADGEMGWIHAHGEPAVDPDTGKRFLVGSVTDITRLRRAEEQLRLMTAELNHRERNLLGMLQAMVRLTGDRAPDVKTFAETLDGRLAALGRTHDLFVRRDNHRVPLVQIILAEMAAMSIPPDRFRIVGETEFALHSKTAESATLIVHELITNALRHGAFSTPKGRVQIRIAPQSESGAFITWTESAGPTVRPPRRDGFGLNIMQTALGADGRVSIEYRPEGIVCEIELLASRPQPTMDIARTTVLPVEMPNLKGNRILVLEDEALIALSLEMTLSDEGVTVVGPFSSAAQAMEAIDDGIDAAVLDVNLGRNTSLDVAQRLAKMGKPFVFVTGDGDWHRVANTFPDVPILEKPIREVDVVVSLGRVLKKAAMKQGADETV